MHTITRKLNALQLVSPLFYLPYQDLLFIQRIQSPQPFLIFGDFMNIFKFRDQLIDEYRSYVTSFIKIADPNKEMRAI